MRRLLNVNVGSAGKRICAILTLPLLASALYTSPIAAQADLQYQNRGDRYEGVRPQPVSEYDVELISALVDYRESASAFPDHLRIRFFLENAAEVHVTIREIEVKDYYWLDRVRPARPWGRGFANEFSWPSAPVLKRLMLPVSELAAVVRIGRPEPSPDERVAPAILFHTRPPVSITSYMFAFKTSSDARIAYTIYRDQHADLITAGGPLRPRGRRPFPVHWDASKAKTGWYRLVLEGYFLDTNQRFQQTVRFVHQPRVE